MAELKTEPNDSDVETFLAGIEDERRREECREVVALLTDVTGEEPVMWGGTIIGFGRYHYVYDSGREGDWFLTGVSPRKESLTLYIMDGFERHEDLMAVLGSYRTGKSCLYLKKLDDVDRGVLAELIQRSVDTMRQRYG